MNLVSDYMSAPTVTIRSSTSLPDILRIFERRVFTGLPVLDEDGRLAGIVSTTDVVRRLTKPLSDQMTAADLMSRHVITVAPGESLDVAAWRLVAARAHRLVVVERDRVLGVLSVDDVLGGLIHRHVVMPLRTIMSSPVESVLLGAPISEALERLSSEGVHGLVAPGGSFAGFFSIAAGSM